MKDRSSEKDKKNDRFAIKLNKLSIILFVVFLILPILNRGLPTLFRASYLIITALIYFLSLCNIDIREAKNTIFAFILTSSFVILMYFGSENQIGFFQDYIISYLFWIPFILLFNDTIMNDTPFMYKLSLIIIVFQTLTAITTLNGLASDRMASRYLATGQTETYGLREYSLRNIGGYATIYSLVISLPIVIGVIKTSSEHKILYCIAVLASVACIMQAQYAMAIIMTITIIPFAFFRVRLSGTRIFLIIVFELIVFSIIWNNLPSVLNKLRSSSTDYLFVVYRLSSTLEDINNNSVQDIDRYQRMKLSLDAFMSSPICGNLILTFPNRLGGHSTILDTLGRIGLLFIPYLLSFSIIIHKRVINRTDKRIRPYALVSILLMVFLAITNTLLSSFTIPTVLFMLSIGLSTQRNDIDINE